MAGDPILWIPGLSEHTQEGRPRDEVDLYVFVPTRWCFGTVLDVDTEQGVAMVAYENQGLDDPCVEAVEFEELYPCERA